MTTNRNGFGRRANKARGVASPFFSIGVRNRLAKAHLPSSRAGIRKPSCDQIPERLFPTGVPDMHGRWRALSARTARLTFQRIATDIGSPELNDSLVIRHNR